ncbi:MAG: hypothetical protein ACJ8AG_12585 [Ktedonobacteraceae bacterium]
MDPKPAGTWQSADRSLADVVALIVSGQPRIPSTSQQCKRRHAAGTPVLLG